MVDINEKAFAAAASRDKLKIHQSQKLKGVKRDKQCENELSPSDRAVPKKIRYTNKTNARNVKAKRNVQKSSNEKVNAARLPKTSADLSSNWKKLLQQMEEQKQRPDKVVGKDLNNDSFRTIVHKKAAITGSVENKTSKRNVIEANATAPEIWFDNADKCLLDTEVETANSDRPNQITDKYQSGLNKLDPLVKDKSFKGLTKAIAMDCEMVGVGYKGEESVLARVSLVNHFGHCVYDKYVKPREKVTDYRTAVSGIRPQDIEKANDFKKVQKEVSDIIGNKILVGHAIRHDFKVLFLDHPKRMIRDTSAYKPFRAAFGGRTPSLKNLSARMLGVSVQQGEHSSVQDAQAAMRLYTMFKKDWEKDSSQRKNKNSHEANANELPVVPIKSDDKNTKKVVQGECSKMSNLSLGLKLRNRLEYEDSD